MLSSARRYSSPCRSCLQSGIGHSRSCLVAAIRKLNTMARRLLLLAVRCTNGLGRSTELDDAAKLFMGVSQNTMTPIHHQYGSTPTPGGGGAFYGTPIWPSHTRQFGVYPVRAPWYQLADHPMQRSTSFDRCFFRSHAFQLSAERKTRRRISFTRRATFQRIQLVASTLATGFSITCSLPKQIRTDHCCILLTALIHPANRVAIEMKRSIGPRLDRH